MGLVPVSTIKSYPSNLCLYRPHSTWKRQAFSLRGVLIPLDRLDMSRNDFYTSPAVIARSERDVAISFVGRVPSLNPADRLFSLGVDGLSSTAGKANFYDSSIAFLDHRD